MAINLHCSRCKSGTSLKNKTCPTCGKDFSNGRKYRVVVKNHDGKRVTKVLDSISMAKKLEGKLKTQSLEKKLLGINKAPTIDEIWKEYLRYAKNNKKKWKDDKLNWEKHIRPTLKGKRMDSIIPLDVQKIINHMKIKRDYAPASIRKIIVLVKRLYNWSSEMGLYEGQNQIAKVKHPKINNEVTECLTREEIKRLFDTLDNWVNQRMSLLIRFTLHTGLRRGEVFGLEWEDVDLEKGFVKLKDPKGGKDEVLPIGDEAIKIIEHAKQLLPIPDCTFVFPNKWGRRRKYLGNTWTKIKISANLPPHFRFHGLRHTFASYLAASGKVSQYTLQKLLTHKSPQMTQRYAHLFDETLREGANLLPTLFSNCNSQERREL